MPIHTLVSTNCLEQSEFDRLDALVMKHAYAAQNKLGRLFDERIYENELARTLRENGREVYTQMPVTVSHATFLKTYYLDLIVDHMLYELKTVASFAPNHDAQALHYATLLNMRRAKLLNFRTERVQGKLCFNRLDRSDRQVRCIDTRNWLPQSEACEQLLGWLRDIVDDWGTHLNTGLYNEALVHFCGGEEACYQRVAVGSLGSYQIQSHFPRVAFVLTSLTRGIEEHRSHLQRMARHLELSCIQWFNFNHATIECRSLLNR